MEQDETHITLAVGGMTCGGCARAVGNAIREVPGVREVRIDLEKGLAEVEGSGVDAHRLADMVRRAGFEASVA